MKTLKTMHSCFLFSSHNGAILEDLVTVLLNSDPYQRPSAVQILNVPALQSYVETSYRKCARHREIQQRLRSLAKQSESPGNCVGLKQVHLGKHNLKWFSSLS